ncbi:EpsG family protein [uncultured Psychrobacter sp.]|uniref:EpsG family protein n=1 Tax=uncultured Psychrobacter sp. TaxID=259303 RepID=UPI002595AD7B|nr:EpsG family protein [uncultured Psychrobacter sp.]
MLSSTPIEIYYSIVFISTTLAVIFSLLSIYSKKLVIGFDRHDLRTNYEATVIALICFLIYFSLPIDSVNDYIAYAQHYISRSEGWYTSSYNYFSSRDLFFFNYVELMSSTGISYRFAYGFIIFLYGYGLFSLSSRLKINPWLVFIIALSFGNIFFVVSGLRQAAAMGLILLATRYFLNKKFIRALLLCILASGFHQSSLAAVAIILICFYFSKYKTTNLTVLVLSLLTVPLLFLQISSFSLVSYVLPYLKLVSIGNYDSYIDVLSVFETNDTTFGLGFIFTLLVKIVYCFLTMQLLLLNKYSRTEQLIVFTGSVYILLFNIMGLNQYTHRLLSYLSPFMYMGLALTLVKYSIIFKKRRALPLITVALLFLFSLIISI